MPTIAVPAPPRGDSPAAAPISASHRTRPSSSIRPVLVMRPSATDRSITNVNGVTMGVGRRYRSANDAVFPAAPTSQLWCCITQSKNRARKPPCTMPGGPS